jgi:phosphoribosylanthranilate isomerase
VNAPPTAVKICGITRRDDALVALEAGADALGIVLAAGSPRFVAPWDAAAMLAAVRQAAAPRAFLAVAVLDRLDVAAARHAIEALGFDRVQLHPGGGTTVAALRATLEEFDLAGAPACGPGPATTRAWGALSVRDRASLAGAETLPCEAVLLDAWAPDAAGGTGRTFEWALAEDLARARRVVLAGGLTPANVGAAIARVRPWMVDVSSGVEAGPGIKDPARVRAFMEAVRPHG